MSGVPSQDRSGPLDGQPAGADAVLSMIRQVGRLASRVHVEQSFKLTRGRLSPDRLLLGVERQRGAAGTDDAVSSLCRTIGMPSDFLPAFQRALPDANHVYFGAERDGQSLTFKAYLEFRDQIVGQWTDTQSRLKTRELYVGYKWDPMDPSRRAVSHYDWSPELTPGEIRQRVQSLVGGDAHTGLRAVTTAMLAQALETVTPQAIQFLEVRELGNPRRSFDINVYKTGARLADWLPSLRMARDHFAVPVDAFDALLHRIGSARAGHLAAGVDRHGRDFLTLYYGGTAMDGERLTRATLAGHA